MRREKVFSYFAVLFDIISQILRKFKWLRNLLSVTRKVSDVAYNTTFLKVTLAPVAMDSAQDQGNNKGNRKTESFHSRQYLL